MALTPPAAVPTITMPNLSDPITLRDITSLTNYQHEVRTASGVSTSAVTKEQAAEVDTFVTVVQMAYGTTAFNAQQAVAPNWFAGALAAGLQPLQTQLTTDVARVQTDVEQIQTDVAQIQTDVARISETLIVNQQWSIKAYNLQCGNGKQREYGIIVFNDGRSPSDIPGLPLLTNFAAVKRLSVDSAQIYMDGYGLGQLPNLPARKNMICGFIGCTEKV